MKEYLITTPITTLGGVVMVDGRKWLVCKALIHKYNYMLMTGQSLQYGTCLSLSMHFWFESFYKEKGEV